MVGVADCLRGMPRVRRRSLSSFTVASVRSLPGTASTTASIALCGSHAGRLFAAHISVRDYSPHTSGERAGRTVERIITGEKEAD